MDRYAINAGMDMVGLLGRLRARTLLTILELPDEERLLFISSMYQREEA